ncbi:hypothetical protein [Arenibacterium halophilum]|uniref:DUF4034 domain-containing protein n=1 Tax=Arenibacterium halophilum TaxID=2583821 RepID=A0ABY2WXD5_9RHOB|nr:hypothetical protein [Arenibacterium halophilum]TMV07476.1 hypothetical protein FGK64_21685 [Arenibacterium halophilum]
MRHLAIFATLWMALCPSLATAEAPISSDPDALRSLVYAGDISRVDAALVAAQLAVEEGDLDAEKNRQLYTIFAVTHPDVIAFTQDWLAARPDSAQAKVARSLVLSNAAWIVRGERALRHTHPEAVEKFGGLRAQAADLAQAAYKANPKFLPASDAVITLGALAYDKTYAMEVFHAVMETTPNWGTLTRAFGFANRGWGGDAQIVEAICDYYAPKVDLGDRDSARYCRIQFLVEGKPYNGWSQMALDLMPPAGEDSWIDGLRFTARLNNHPMDRAEAEALRDIVVEQGFDSLRWATYYDQYIAYRWAFDTQTERTLQKVKVGALAALEHDPFNPELLDILARQSHEVTKVEIEVDGKIQTGTRHTPIADSPSPEQEFDYLRRKVVVAPYDPENWQKLALLFKVESLRGRDELADLALWEGYLVNAVYYSNYQLEYLTNYAQRKIQQLESYEQLEPGMAGLNGWYRAIQQLDRTTDIVCPIVRIGILIYAVAQYTGQNPGLDTGTVQVIDGLTAEAEADDLCPGMLSAQPQDLAFAPVEMDMMGQVFPFILAAK